ncbi:SLC13 family permease [Amphiplicatus metriothermophilus]|uniref:Di- and tricarboxylate transporter n=1 Tax=Amphiplicatus metriothermophilus TaxID=1519374 RepID=A0A239PXS2_9PROT|nr:SLC13 family permease [Amphiplicatus metriothermophilus]MBB5519840.1 di/tricarboxylate transporter [Amphiplicatus metriothermophilus]SNT75109.1 Di- and tricarboxylate transporter [Amphiplicatus metriothermophilus]
MDLAAAAPWQMWATFAIILVTIVLYALDRFSLELVSAGSLAAFLILFQLAPLVDENGRELLSPQVLFSGFASPALIAIMCLLIIGQGIFQSGAMELPTRYLVEAVDQRPAVVTVTIFALALAISAFLNDTPVVVMFIPIVSAIAAQGKIPASRLMMPLSFIALFGGMTTLIGSSTNILAAGSYTAITGRQIGFFDLTPLALVLGTAGIIYLATAGRLLLPRRLSPDEIRGERESKQFIAQIEITPGHPLVGKGAVSGLFPDLPDITVRMVQRGGQAILPPFDNFSFRPHDVVIVAATRQALTNLLKSTPEILDSMMAETTLDVEGAGARAQQLTMVEAVVAPGSRMIGRSIAQIGLHYQTNCVVIGIERRSRMIRAQMNTIRLEAGDVLLIVGPTSSVQALRADRDLLVLEWSMTGLPAIRHARTASAIFVGVVALAASGLAPIAVAAFIGAMAMVATGCLNVRQASRAIDRRIFLLIGSSLAMGAALEETGGALAIGGLIAMIGESLGPAALLSAIFIISAATTNVLSNNATAVLFTPIAVSAANLAGIDPEAAVLSVIYGANCPFATPIAYQTNLLVMTPGHYKFRDYIVVGGPLIVLMWIVYTIAAPFYFRMIGAI